MMPACMQPFPSPQSSINRPQTVVMQNTKKGYSQANPDVDSPHTHVPCSRASALYVIAKLIFANTGLAFFFFLCFARGALLVLGGGIQGIKGSWWVYGLFFSRTLGVVMFSTTYGVRGGTGDGMTSECRPEDR